MDIHEIINHNVDHKLHMAQVHPQNLVVPPCLYKYRATGGRVSRAAGRERRQKASSIHERITLLSASLTSAARGPAIPATLKL